MSFTQFISILRARWWQAMLVFLLVVGTTVAISLYLPKNYGATASVVIDVKPDPVAAMMNPMMASPSFMATQVDILNSARVASKVIRELKLNENVSLRQQWQEDTQGQGSFEQWLIDVLQKKLEVRPSRESNVISIRYEAIDPRFAAGLANAFAQAYIATTLELKVDPAQKFERFFDAQTREAREALEAAQARISAFQQEKGILATDERLDIESARLSELSSQLTQMQAIAAESRSRQGQAEGGQAERMQEVLNNPLIASLKADVSRQEARLTELSARLGSRHPQVIEAKASIGELRSRVDAETRRVTSGVTVSNTINRSRESQMQAALERQRSKVLEMKSVRDQGLVLQRDADNAQRRFDSLTARLTQTALEAQSTQSYAHVLTTASPPTEPSSPRVGLNTALAVFLGALLGLGTALVWELSDRRVRTPEDVVNALGIPLLGAMPKPNAKRYLAGNRAVLPNSSAPLALGLASAEHRGKNA